MSVDGWRLVNKTFLSPQSQVYWYIKDIKHQRCWLHITQLPFCKYHKESARRTVPHGNITELEVVRERLYRSATGNNEPLSKRLFRSSFTRIS